MTIYLQLIWVFGKIGAVTYGGGYAMISLFLQEVVSRGWVTPEDFANIVAVSQMTPGPIAMNTATYTGKLTGGIFGAIIASLSLAIPPMIYLFILLKASKYLGQSSKLKPFIKGVRVASIGMIGTAVLFFAENSVFSTELPLNLSLYKGLSSIRDLISPWMSLGVHLPALLIALLIFVLSKKFNWKPIPSIGLSVVLGMGLFSFF
ncbi:chromate transporter [Spirochaeta cellobiosiphila]|uniref:chromate transporter n=1 Tax=Spirochaeta cellobiosiphila TaxID=504483 RepID=UPI000425BC12|nr:chromate transporter [Spirochaeta cellobiosiphila]